MKKTFRTLIISLMAVLMLLTSCNDKLQKMDEGSVNEYIYPYIKFKPAEDGNSVTAVVVAGARLNTVRIPATVDGVKVNTFIGFENPEDAKCVKEIVIGSHDTVITDEALKQAINLEQVKFEKAPEIQYWGKLPVLEKDGYEFLGWYAGDDKVFEGMMMDPENTVAIPVWRAHKYIHHEGKPATCTESGIKEYWECPDCGKKFKTNEGKLSDIITDITIAPLGHFLVHHEFKDATCTEPGNIEYWECSRCKKTFSDSDGKIPVNPIIATYGHDFVSRPKVEPTCVTEGYKAYDECKRCGIKVDPTDHSIIFTDDEITIPMIPHTPDEIWHHGNGDSSDTHHWHVCDVCKQKVDYELHDWDAGKVISDEDGIQLFEYTCSVCEAKKYERKSDGVTHHFDIYVKTVSATCTKPGYDVFRCSDPGCNKTIEIVDESKPALGHSVTQMDKKDPTCTEKGREAYWHCDRCGLDYREKDCINQITDLSILDIDALGHDWVYMHDETQHWEICNRCYEEKGGSRSVHDFNQEKVEDKYKRSEATCTEPETYFKSCICGTKHHGDEYFVTKKASGHDLEKYAATDKPCAEDGHIEYWECTKCKKKFSDAEGNTEITEVRGKHTPDKNWEADEHKHYLRCSVCGELLETQAHTFVQTHDANYHWMCCEICSYRDEQSVEPHDFVSMGDGREQCHCGYIHVPSPEPGGMDADFINKEPAGSIEVKERQGNIVTITFIEKKASYPCDRFEWRLDGNTIEGEKGMEFTFDASQKRTYKVMCIYRNEYGGASMSMTVPGGY